MATKTKKMPFTGFHLSSEMDQCIRMYAHSKDIPMSQVLRSITREWFEGKCITQDYLIDEIIKQATVEWEKRKFVNPEANIDLFIGDWGEDLVKKIPMPLVDQILQRWCDKNVPKQKG